MANPAQGQSPLAQGTGTWLDFDLAIPDFLAPVREAIDNIAQLLITILNVLLAVLDVIKAFTSAFLDPLVALVEALIALIEQFTNDLRNAGFYIHGDWWLLQDGPEFRNLLGGYQAYERRMIQRLIDPRDPNRPVLSPASTVIALFFYQSADASTFLRLLNFIRGIMALFGRERNFQARALGTVADIRVEYGIDSATDNFIGGTKTLFDSMLDRRDGTLGIRQIGEPNLATIKWKLSDPPGNFVSPVARLLPQNFVVEVSTEPHPLYLQYDMAAKGSQDVPPDPAGAEESPGRIQGLVVDENGRTLQVTGGIDQFRLQNPPFFYVPASGPGASPDPRPRVFAFKNAADSTPIPLEKLKEGSDYYLQRSFFFRGIEVGGITPGQFMSAVLRLEDMPKRATFNEQGEVVKVEEVDTFYVRVRAVSRTIDPEDRPLRFVIDNTMFQTGTVPVIARVDQTGNATDKVSILDRGESSAQVRVTFPNANTAAFLECVLAALYVLMLSRPDLQPLLDDEGNFKEHDPDDSWSIYEGKVKNLTSLEDIAKVILPQLTGRRLNNEKFWSSWSDPLQWRKKIFTRCVAMVNRLYNENQPPPSVQGLVVNVCKPLLEWKLDDLVSELGTPISTEQSKKGVQSKHNFQNSGLTLIEAFQSDDMYAGIAANPISVGTYDQDLIHTRNQLRDDINAGLHGDVYSPSFYTTDNSQHLMDEETLANTQAQADALQQEIDDLVNEFQAQASVGDAGAATTLENISTLRQKQSSLQQSINLGPTAKNKVVKGSVTQAPVFYVRRGTRISKMTYCRNAFDAEIYNAAQFALQMAVGPVLRADGGWMTLRLGQLFPGIDHFLDEILAWIKALAAAVDSIAKAIRRFIDYLRGRIIELQRLIQRINAILQNLFRLFDILPRGAILPVVAAGTTGVLTDLVTAQNKPFDGPSSYGGGAVALASAGPLFPSFFLDIFAGD